MDREPTARDHWRAIRNRWTLVVCCVVAASTVAIVGSMASTPNYVASSEVLVQPRGLDGLFVDGASNLNSRAVQTEVQVIEGRDVRDRVAQDTGQSDPAGVEASPIGETDAIRLSVRSTNRANAATLANAYATAYIDVRREQSVSELLAAGSEVQRAIDNLQVQIDGLPDGDPRVPSLIIQQASFRTTLDQLRVDAALLTGGATVILEAEIPVSPVAPKPLRSGVLAAFVGLLIGIGAALLLEYSDDKVRTDDDLERIGGLPLLAHVPVDPPPDSRPLAMSDSSHSSVEAYRGLRTNVQFLALDRSMTLVQVTSSLAAEGKTTTATNLAVVLAQAGNRVAMVDADLRRPRIHEVFGVSPSPGLTDLLLGASPSEVRVAVEADGGSVHVYPSGDLPVNPSELLSGDRARQLLQRMAEHYDYVIIDSAPVLPVSDSVALAAAVDGVILVAQAGRATVNNVEDSLERLQQVSAPVLGFVLNRASDQDLGSYSYGYGPSSADRGREPEPVDT